MCSSDLPPYNVAYEGGTKEKLTIQNDDMSDDDFRQFLRDVYIAADAVMKPGAAFYIWHADSEGYNFRGAAKDVGWQVRQCLIWNKSSLVLGRQDYHWKHEPCLYAVRDGKPSHRTDDRTQCTVWDIASLGAFGRTSDTDDAATSHGTQKPVECMARPIRNHVFPPDTCVYDPFLGSGTTLIAAEREGRIACGMELTPAYVGVILQRCKDAGLEPRRLQ